MYSISAYNLDGTGGVLYDPNHFADEKREVYDISTVEKELGKAGSFSFTVPRVNPLYDDIYRFGTEISVYRQPGTLMWRGRVSSITRDFYLNKAVRCEGALCYLNDIIVRPFVYRLTTGNSFRTSPLGHYMTVAGEYGRRCSAGREMSFSTNIEESDILAQTEPYSFAGVSEYVSVYEAMGDILELDDKLSLDVTYMQAGCSVVLGRLPFFVMEEPESGTGIDFGVNLLDYSDEYESDDVCTAIVPLGKDNRVLYDDNSDVDEDSFTSTNLAARYGKIEKVVHFENANSNNKLRTCTNTVLRMLERDDKPRIRLRAVDLFHFGLNADMIDIGWQVPIRSNPHGLLKATPFVCIQCSIDIENSENSSYTFRTV